MVMDKLDAPAQTAMYGGAGASIAFLGMGVNEWAAIISAAVAVIGGLYHLWVLSQRRREEKLEHKARMAQLTAGTGPAK